MAVTETKTKANTVKDVYCSECGRKLHDFEIECYEDICHECYKILID